MVLSRAGCARLWLSVQERPPRPFEARWGCRACPIGAAHAGREDAQEAADTEAAAMALEGLCPRCRRRGQRLIGASLCVSCYNRSREVLRGKNRKGNRPRVVEARLGAVALLVAAPGSPHAVRATGWRSVTGAPEAMLAAAKAAKGGPLVFARPPAPAFQAAAA